jgi:hypothetical protein
VEQGWEGEAFLIVRARDALGHSAEALIKVQVSAAVAALSLTQNLEIDLLEGDTEFRVPLSDLFADGQVPPGLTWEASGDQSVSVGLDEGGGLILRGTQPWTRSQTLTLTARDPQNHLATGQLQLEVHPADGSAGQEVPEFRLALVANPLQPDFLDLYVLSDLPLSQAPRLRLQDGQTLAVTQWPGHLAAASAGAAIAGFP